MNYLLLLAGLVLVVCLMNSKDLMKSDLVKSVSSKSKSVSKSLGVDSTTLLVVVFVGAVLFMCMNKSVEGFTLTDEMGCPRKFTKMHVYDPKKPDEKNHAPVCFNPSDMEQFRKALDKNTKPTPKSGPGPESVPEIDNKQLELMDDVINERQNERQNLLAMGEGS